jgi:hypothetical protein
MPGHVPLVLQRGSEARRRFYKKAAAVVRLPELAPEPRECRAPKDFRGRPDR